MEQTEWVLPLRDGTVIKIPPDKVANLNKKIADKEPIRLKNGRVILYQEIASGVKPYVPELPNDELLAQAAKAFGDAELNEHGEVICVWVKEDVNVSQWNKYYSQFATYYKLGNNYDNVVIAYRVPLHTVDNSLQRCNPTEVQTLETKLANS